MSAAAPAPRQEPDALAAGWLAQLLSLGEEMSATAALPGSLAALVTALSSLCASCLARGERLLIVTADDQL